MVLLTAAVFAASLAVIVLRPFGIREAWPAVIGALAMIATGALTPGAALGALVAQWNLFLFFLGLMLTAAAADRARFFDWAAALAAGAARGSGRRLLVSVLAVAALITAFLSNDATALILTPVVHGVTRRLGVRPLPYLFAVSFMANSASLTLPISNPTNVITADALRLPLGVYEAHLLAAALAAVLVTVGVLVAVFWRATASRFVFDWRPAVAAAAGDRMFRPVVAGLAVLATAYVAASALLLPLGVVAAAGGVALVALAAVFGEVRPAHLRAHLSLSLFAYIAGLFVLVRGVEAAGVTQALVAVAAAQVSGPATAVLAGVAASAVGSNLVNNLPALLVFISGSGGGHLAAGLRTPFVLGALAGADLGPNLTPVGALSTMLWLVIVRRHGIDVSAWDFLRLGSVVAPLTLVAAAALVALSFRLTGP